MLPSLSEIRQRRVRLQLTQSQLSKLSGVSQSLIAKLESGRLDPSYSRTKILFDSLESEENKGTVTAGELMRKQVVGVEESDSVERAVQIMERNEISQLPVFKTHSVTGSISEKIILDRMNEGENPKEISQMLVREVMIEPFPRVSQETPINAVVSLLEHNYAVIVESKGKVSGIITKADLLKVVHR